MKCIFTRQNLQIFVLNMSIFYPLVVVGRGGETQLQMDEKLNWITKQLKGSLTDRVPTSGYTYTQNAPRE